MIRALLQDFFYDAVDLRQKKVFPCFSLVLGAILNYVLYEILCRHDKFIILVDTIITDVPRRLLMQIDVKFFGANSQVGFTIDHHFKRVETVDINPLSDVKLTLVD